MRVFICCEQGQLHPAVIIYRKQQKEKLAVAFIIAPRGPAGNQGSLWQVLHASLGPSGAFCQGKHNCTTIQRRCFSAQYIREHEVLLSIVFSSLNRKKIIPRLFTGKRYKLKGAFLTSSFGYCPLDPLEKILWRVK